MTPTDAEREKAREIAHPIVRSCWNIADHHTRGCDQATDLIASALAAARAQALEEAAQWCDEQEAQSRSKAMGLYSWEGRTICEMNADHCKRTAAALRNLKQPQEPPHEP